MRKICKEPTEPLTPPVSPIEFGRGEVRFTPAAMAQTAWPKGGVRRHAHHGRGNELETLVPPPGDEATEGAVETEE